MKIILILMPMLFLLFSVPQSSYAQTVREYQKELMTDINKIRTEKKLKPLKIDPSLCEIAHRRAANNALLYPKSESNSVFSISDYKEYTKGYSKIETFQLTLNDIFVNPMKQVGEFPVFSYEDVMSELTTSDKLDPKALATNSTAGCIGVSGKNVGYKQFVEFVRGTEKTFWNNFPFSILEVLSKKFRKS